MGDKSAISWTGSTWNVTRGCARVSPGCQNCYAEEAAARVDRQHRAAHPDRPPPYDGLIKLTGGQPRWTGVTRFVPALLSKPLSKGKPEVYFVDSMSDLFHDGFTNEQIAAVFGVMAAAPRHTFQVLTKRAKRMEAWFDWLRVETNMRGRSQGTLCLEHAAIALEDAGESSWSTFCYEQTRHATLEWPLPNVWLGVSVENQEAADDRIPFLLDTPAAVRFVSCEPLLAEFSLWPFFAGMVRDAALAALGSRGSPGLDWVIAGCESGQGARPCDVEWLREMRRECATASVPFFLKQAAQQLSHSSSAAAHPIAAGEGSKRKRGGIIELPYLDGVKHCAFPEVP